MKFDAVVFVESPLQLLNAVEAFHFYNIKKPRIYVRLAGKDSSDLQMIQTISKLNIHDINLIYVRIPVKNYSLKNYFTLLFMSFRFLFTQVDCVFFGNWDSGFFKVIRKQFKSQKIIYLDDGAKTLITPVNSILSKSKLFTIYEFLVNQANINTNRFVFLRTAIKGVNIDKKTVLFLGQKLSEIGIINQEKYIEIISEIGKQYIDYEVLYVPHREESLIKLNKIKKIKNVEVVTLEYPVELYGLQRNVPFKVLSFYSTALYTMQVIYGVESEAIQLCINNKNVNTIYDVYRKKTSITINTDYL